MLRTRTFTLTLLIILSSCHWSPHYLSNDAVQEVNRLYSPDSSKFILTYDLNVGARGSRLYQSIIIVSQENESLDKFHIPWELSKPKWLNNNEVEVTYDRKGKTEYGGYITDLDISQDTIEINQVLFILK